MPKAANVTKHQVQEVGKAADLKPHCLRTFKVSNDPRFADNVIDVVRELRPEDTELVNDPSPHYRRSRLSLETLLRRIPPTDSRLLIEHAYGLGAAEMAERGAPPLLVARRWWRPRALLLVTSFSC